MNVDNGRIGRIDELTEPERARVITLGDQASPMQDFAELVARMREAQGEVNPAEAERLYADAPAPLANAPTMVELTGEEARKLAAIPNEGARLKAFRKLRANAPCNVCHRLIGNHLDKQIRVCFRKMADAVENRRVAEAGERASRSVDARTIHQV